MVSEGVALVLWRGRYFLKTDKIVFVVFVSAKNDLWTPVSALLGGVLQGEVARSGHGGVSRKNAKRLGYVVGSLFVYMGGSWEFEWDVGWRALRCG